MNKCNRLIAIKISENKMKSDEKEEKKERKKIENKEVI